jgi:hypothetical protein
MKISRKDHPKIFEEISEAITSDLQKEHRRNSNFYTVSLVEFKPEHRKYYPEVDNYDDYIGYWKTNTYISDPEHGTDWGEITELTKVEKKSKMIEVYTWEEVK